MLELIYIIADADCAAARKAAVASGKEIQFRNLYYPEVKADYDARGGTKLPAIWDGTTLHQGLAAVLAVIGPPRQH